MLQGVAIAIANDSNDDGLNQSFRAHVSPSANREVAQATATTSTISTMVNPSESPELLLLRNDKFLTHVAHLLNITTENLSNLLGSTNGTNASTMAAADPSVDESLTLRTAFTICYALIFVAGVLGNLITCIVISRNNFMHTATNFYLFNLAVSDLILLVSGIPQELYNLWYPDMYPFTDAMCIMGSVLSEMAANATVLTITAFTVERYIAICHPFRQHTMSKLSRAIKFIFAIWLAAFLLALPQAMQFSVVFQNDGYSCTMENDFYAHVFAVSGFIFFGGPMTAICVLYVLIGVKLKRSRLLQSLPRRTYDANRGLNAQGRVIRMLVAVAVAFFLCWAPFHAQRLMAVYGLNLINIGISRDAFNDYFRILDYTSGVLYFLSTCINPLLYNIMSHKFREAFKITLTRQFGLARNHHHQQSQHHQHNYSALLRQNGSMRLQPASCSVNNNALEPYGSYRVVQFRCRDANHQLSLQDSIRTTTTTTTINSASLAGNGVGGGGGGRRLRKQEFYGPIPGTAVPHRMLQAQVSQLSSLGDANSLLESEVVDRHYASGRAKRALLATKSGALLVTPPQNADASEVSQPATRLKLTRVISRRDEVTSAGTPPFCGSHSLPDPETCQSVASVASRSSRKFPWRKRRQKTEEPSSEVLAYGSPKSQ
ncbi:somatostatin receptor type 5 [Drosophila ficusphila]|uniref:somatostatin receptor type 5 n=1 Tax=Drosophila ficusphila TaxID=30025 RepID=UPI0007E8B230|nr:somatostatin receptor type 5 [Drosophila ficusphila]XP_017039737.1 somatostatin receptor type 5 [Drosophila ficusphila]XP_017039738.1 somatostatin receptor type 5 [Drosophila ficusphila]